MKKLLNLWMRLKDNFFNTEYGSLLIQLATGIYLLFVASSFLAKAWYFETYFWEWAAVSAVLYGLVNYDKVKRRHDEMVSSIYALIDAFTVKLDHLFIELMLLVGLLVYLLCGAEVTARVLVMSAAVYYAVISAIRLMMFRRYDRAGIE